jgi:hypothetical protein
MIGREELFALAAAPLGDRSIQDKVGKDFQKTKAAFAKRAQKVWLPAGKLSANTNAQREHERSLKALNFDIEDAVEAAGGQRGHSA